MRSYVMHSRHSVIEQEIGGNARSWKRGGKPQGQSSGSWGSPQLEAKNGSRPFCAFSRRVADGRLRRRPGDQPELMVSAVLVLGKFVGDHLLRPVRDPGAPPHPPGVLLVVRQKLGIHQPRIQRDLLRVRHGTPSLDAGEDDVNLAAAAVLVQPSQKKLSPAFPGPIARLCHHPLSEGGTIKFALVSGVAGHDLRQGLQ